MSAVSTVFRHEMRLTWLGGRAPVLLTLFSVMIGIMAFLFATNKELNLIPPRESLVLLAQSALAVAILVCLILGADSIAGERDRGSLEALLLTPVPRRTLVMGKFAAALTPWPAILVVTTPFLYQLAPDMEAFLAILMWMTLLGTLLVVGFTALGVFISTRAGSTKSSLAISLGVFLIALLPTQFPGKTQTGALGVFIKQVNPAESVAHLLAKLTVNNNSPADVASFFISPIALAVLGLLLIAARRDPKMPLSGGDS